MRMSSPAEPYERTSSVVTVLPGPDGRYVLSRVPVSFGRPWGELGDDWRPRSTENYATERRLEYLADQAALQGDRQVAQRLAAEQAWASSFNEDSRSFGFSERVTHQIAEA